jgi:hypothetical protein
MMADAILAEGVGFEPTRERDPLPVFKTGALNHSATLPCCNFNKLTNISTVENRQIAAGLPPDGLLDSHSVRACKKLASMIAAARSSMWGKDARRRRRAVS